MKSFVIQLVVSATLVAFGRSEEGRDEEGVLHVNEAWGSRIGGRLIPVVSKNYPGDLPANMLQTWYIQTSPRAHAIRLICYDIRLATLRNGKCGAWGFKVIDGDEVTEYCGSKFDLNMLSKTDELRMELRTGHSSGGGVVNCTVQARELGPDGEVTEAPTTEPPPQIPPFLQIESEEIDSSEHGTVPGPQKPTCPCGWTNKESARIVGGREAKIHEYPHVVALALALAPTGVFCGGSLVTPYHVLTAAHCTVRYRLAGLQLAVRVAEHNYQSNDDTNLTQVINVAKIIEHEGYSFPDHNHDIALLVLEKKVEFNQFIGPICLPKKKLDLGNSNAKILGWGRIENSGFMSNVLKTVHVRAVPTEQCLGEHSSIFMCTYATKRGSCRGDSGGPVMWLDPDTNRYTLVGLVSHGPMCADRSPIVNTDVSYYIDWIHSKVRETSPDAQLCTNFN